VRETIALHLKKAGIAEKVLQIRPLSGGDIGNAFQIECARKKYFIKMTKAGGPKGLIQAEIKNLNLLAELVPENIPKFYLPQNEEVSEVLILDYITPEQPNRFFWDKLARSLAKVHAQKSEKFGLFYANYIGSISQPNVSSSSFANFFGETHILYMYKKANQFFETSFHKKIETLCSKLANLIPEETPSLIHGDLWSGNFLCGQGQKSFFIDPACTFGHREADIAMSKLFGGFDQRFYEAYQEATPLADGWAERLDLFQLYPLLVHVNLFGAQYVPSCKSIISKYS